MKLEVEEKINIIKIFKKYNWLWTILLVFFSAVLSTIMIQYLLLDAELFEKLSDKKWTLNIGCVLVVYLLNLCITAKVNLSVIISHCFFMVLGFVNYFVYLFRDNEFTFADLRSIGTGLSVAGNYELVLHDRGWHVILVSIAYCLLLRMVPITFKRTILLRVFSVSCAIFGGLMISDNTQKMNAETWEQKGTYNNGYVLNFVLTARDSFVSPPEGYDLEVIEELEKNYGQIIKNPLGNELEKKPAIIVIMNESFADLSVIGELETNEPLTPFMDSLEENTVKGYALSSVFGAKTPNSEWEFLTGGTMAFLPSGSVVYQQYISNTPASLVSTLKNEGYTSVAMHPYYETGWRRNLIYPNMGFDETYFLDDFDQSKLIRKYVSDRELYRKIIERYENRAKNEDLFIMSISMQNHGGYTSAYENFEEKYYKIGRSYSDANQYFSLIRESDDALAELITYFSQADEPVEIIFFGDHQPSLNKKFYKLLNGKGLSRLTLEQLEALYTVPFFIWTNYDTPEEVVEITSLNYLSTMALERAGIDLPPYHRFLAELMEVVPAINARGYYSLDKGRYIHVEDALGEEFLWISKYRNLQYNSLFDRKNTSEMFFPYLAE